MRPTYNYVLIPDFRLSRKNLLKSPETFRTYLAELVWSTGNLGQSRILPLAEDHVVLQFPAKYQLGKMDSHVWH